MCGPTLHLLDGLSRYFLCLFPLFLLMGRMRSSPLRVGLWALSFVAQVCLVMGFLDWRWVA
jgi:hypothetical protein